MSSERYKTNPFLLAMVVPVKGRQVQLSRLGSDNEQILINRVTGEVQGTHVTTYRKVDGEQFVKLFTQNIGMTFDLTSAGIKAFSVVVWTVQNKAISKDEIDLDSFTLDDFISSHSVKGFSPQTFQRGIRELEKSQIVAKTRKRGRYFINPNFVFNGDRIAFTTLLERSTTHNEDQHELPL